MYGLALNNMVRRMFDIKLPQILMGIIILTGRIQIKVPSTLPFFFLEFLFPKINIYTSKMCNWCRITISFQLKISISIMIKRYFKHQRKQNAM